MSKSKSEGGVVLAGQHDEAGDIGPRLFHHIAQGDEGPCPLGHLEGFAVLVEFDELDQLDVQRHATVGQGRNGGLHPFDVTAVVGAEDVDELVEAALHLVVVIGDIGGEIGP